MRPPTRAIVAALLVPALLAPGTLSESQPWPSWFDETLRVRVPIQLTPGPAYPADWGGPRLVVHELDVTDALARGGWPLDSITGIPQRFTVDVHSVRAVARTEPPTGVPALVFDGPLLSPVGTYAGGHQVVTVAFAAVPGVDSYHLYFDRTEDGTHPAPVVPGPAKQRILQLLAGPGAGHTNLGFVEGAATLLVASNTTATVRIERLTSQGWLRAGCGDGFIGQFPTSWITCGLDTTGNPPFVRVTADRPVAVYAWPRMGASADNPREKSIPLAGANGLYESTTLFAPAPRVPTTVALMSLRPCPGGCTASIVSGNNAPGFAAIPVGVPSAGITISGPSLIVSNSNTPFIGWIPGRGPANMAMAIHDDVTTGGVVLPKQTAGSQRVTAGLTGETGSRASLVSQEGVDDTRILTKGHTFHAEHDLRGATWGNLPGGQDTRYTLQIPDALAWGSVMAPEGQEPGVIQLGPSTVGAAGWIGPSQEGVDVRLYAAAFGGDAPVKAAIDGTEVRFSKEKASIDDPPQTGAITYGKDAGEFPENVGGIAEVWTVGTPRLVAAYAVVGEPLASGATPAEKETQSKASGLFTGFLKPVSSVAGEAQIIGPLLRLALEPDGVFARPGETVAFSVRGAGRIQNADGSITPLEIRLAAAADHPPTLPPADLQLDAARVLLDPNVTKDLTRLTVGLPREFPPGALPDTYTVKVEGVPVGGTDTVTAAASVTVRVKRELSLSFEDGTKTATLKTVNGRVSATLVLENRGTGPETVGLSLNAPLLPGWRIRLLESGSDVTTLTLGPGEQRRLTFDVTAPQEGSVVIDALVTAQSLEDASVSDTVRPRIVHGVTLDVDTSVLPDLVTLHRGDRAVVNLTLHNHGSPVNAYITPLPVDGLVAQAGRRSINLGEEGTGFETAVVPLNVTIEPDAPLGAVIVATVEVKLGLGSLEPTRVLLSLRARVVPIHSLVTSDSPDILPGIRQALALTLRAAGETDEDVTLALLEAPPGWTVQAPSRVTVPFNNTAPVRVNLTTPAGTPPGPATLRFAARPLDGTDPIVITVRPIVLRSAAFTFDALPPLQLGLGGGAVLKVAVTNLGNDAGEARLVVDGEGVQARPTPAALALAPGDSGEFTLLLDATEVGEHVLTLRAEPGVEQPLFVRVGRVELDSRLVSLEPSPPRTGASLVAVVEIRNSGDAPARDVAVALAADGETLTEERIGLLDPGGTATVAVRTDNVPSADLYEVRVDPAGRYVQNDRADDVVVLNPQEAPGPAAWWALVAAAAAVLLKRRRT